MSEPTAHALKAFGKGRRLRVAERVCARHDVHLRVAADLVQIANRFAAKIMLAKDDHHVDGKSILGVLMLGIARGTELRIIAVGRDAEAAVTALAKLFRTPTA